MLPPFSRGLSPLYLLQYPFIFIITPHYLVLVPDYLFLHLQSITHFALTSACHLSTLGFKVSFNILLAAQFVDPSSARSQAAKQDEVLPAESAEAKHVAWSQREVTQGKE